MITIYNKVLSVIFILCFNICSTAQTWNTVGDSTQILNYDSLTPGGTVFVIKQIDSLLYVGGGFVYAGDIKVNSIATWDGTKWDSIGSGDMYGNGVHDIFKYNNEIYKGSTWFMKWNGSTWITVGTGLITQAVRAIKKYKGQLYLGGSNFNLNSSNLHNMASWDGFNYAGLNGGVVGPFERINALTEYNGELVAGGYFNYAGAIEAFNIAAWHGNNWHDIDTGTSDIVEALVVDTINNFLYVGGGFTSVGGFGGIITSCIARWDGYQWDSLAGGLPYCDVMALCMYHNNLYVGMCLSGSISNPPGFAKWNGKEWTIWDTSNGPNDAVTALGVYNDELYVGGGFTKIGSDSVFGIARYYELPDTTCDYIQAIIQPKNAVLKISDSTIVHFYNNIIHGSSWHWNFGDGGTDTVRTPIHTYADTGVYNVSVIVTYHNCIDTAYTTITIIDDTGIKENDFTTYYLGQNIPNPFDKTTSIPYFVPNKTISLLQISDSRGQLINEFKLQQGGNSLTISLDNLKAGLYFYSISIDGIKKETKTMILK